MSPADAEELGIKSGDVDELAKKYEGQRVATEFPALGAIGDVQANSAYVIKDCMLDGDYDRVVL